MGTNVMEIEESQPDLEKLDSSAAAEIDTAIAEIAQKLPLKHEYDIISRQEREVLQLYQQLKELELEEAILQAEAETSHETLNIEDEDVALKTAQKELLEARALYQIRQNVVEDVLQADPILKAVHSGSNATPTERNLHPLVDQRDILAMCHNNLSSELYRTLDQLTVQQAKTLKAMESNRALTAELLDLTSQLKERELDDIQDSQLLSKLQAAEAEAKEARKQYRIVKGVVSGVIAGSGVDWARNEQLRDLVLDTDD